MILEDVDQALTEVLGEPVTPGDWQLTHEDAEWKHFHRGTCSVERKVTVNGSKHWIEARRVTELVHRTHTERADSIGARFAHDRRPGVPIDKVVFWVSNIDLPPSRYPLVGVPLVAEPQAGTGVSRIVYAYLRQAARLELLDG